MLSGIKVIDFTRYLPGPHATLRLADFGAEIIKVEEPAGDPGRGMGIADVNGEKKSSMYLSQNRSKKGITVDLKNPGDVSLIYKLVKDADVFIESFRPGVSKKLGIDFDTLIKLNPNLVYCSMTGYGQESPLATLGGHDINYLALSGIFSQMNDRAGKPVKPAFSFADMISGVALSEAVLAGIVYKERNKKGTYIDFSMTDSLISLTGMQVMYKSLAGKEKPSYAPVSYYLYETKDGRYVTLGAIEKKFWSNFCEALGKESWLAAQGSPAKEGNLAYLEIVDMFKSRTLKEWEKFSEEVDCCMMPVYYPGEMTEHPYVKQRRMVEERWGQMHVGTRYIPVGSVLDKATPPPEIGEHNPEIKKI